MMRINPPAAAIVAVIGMAAVLAAQGAPLSCASDCLVSRYWLIPSNDYQQTGKAPFPEDRVAEVARHDDIGIAFSGGGTRSATATLGQLRGLQQLGWLQRIRYVSAVSGGAWAAIPFTFSKRSLDELLGPYVAPGDLTLDLVKASPKGALGQAIARSSLASGALREGAAEYLNIRGRQEGVSNPLLSQIVRLTNRLRREGARDDKTYARLLGRIFIDGLIQPSVSGLSFSWNGDTLNAMSELNPGRLGDVVLAHADRPFLIASGSMVSERVDYVTPLLMPVEFTPMYVGVRQQFGRFGGAYVWPWAYDPTLVGRATPDPAQPGTGTVEVQLPPGRRLTLADVAASTGAAPEIPIINAFGIEGSAKAKIQQAARFFPHFNHFAFRDGTTPLLATGIAHADAGGIDNLGIMPLLARQVHNIIVFNNTTTPLVEENGEMQALFIANAAATATTDSRGNDVFEASKWDVVWRALAARREQQQPQVYCDHGWSVKSNQRFNIRAYDGLAICFVYNASARDWEEALQPAVRALLVDKHSPRGVGKLDNFPYYRTFEQNVPHVIQLKSPQVNLLSNLTGWIVTNPETVKAIRTHFSVASGPLPCPRGMACD